jgi:tetratricopeptide (TPR) repeat protein
MQQGDAFWEERVEVEKVKEALNAYEKVLEEDPDNYEACWKIVRVYFHLGDRLAEIKENRAQHRDVGKRGMQYGEKACTLNPQGIEGHYYYGLCLAKYTLGITFITALTEGLASKYEKHMERAIELDKNYDSAGPLRALGKYWHEIPWPKRNLKKSIAYLKEAVAGAPMNIRGHLYLAESYLKVGEKALAKEQLEIAATLPVDLKEEISARRWQENAQLLLKEKF